MKPLLSLQRRRLGVKRSEETATDPDLSAKRRPERDDTTERLLLQTISTISTAAHLKSNAVVTCLPNAEESACDTSATGAFLGHVDWHLLHSDEPLYINFQTVTAENPPWRTPRVQPLLRTQSTNTSISPDHNVRFSKG